ncbi:CCA tRNA nucleotidyltransferase [Romboutsia lituseburensis]|uniref:CCA tRNA nucleotidyltransferase n=1 Tax=Romboutsia lituseburensis TaxID=1537 RepID=UPI00215B37A5|nr:hypothetical protein [Romboutsia lituseburensis]MCR8745226.1 hypothetical protein [Romboutsia lituseburensis]
MRINLPKTVEFIIDTIYENGYEAFIVGGCVRDFILGISPNDYDITTSANPEKILDIFNNFKTTTNGIKHGTVGIVIDNNIYEITTYRIESEYEDNRRPKEVKFTKNIIEDLKRRDFTINAMAYNYKVGLIDEFEGIKDINQKLIRTVGNPDERFNEDGLRIIRAIRFSSKLGFEIEENTLMSIYKNSKLIKNISKERITDELNKIILSNHPEKIDLLYKSNIFKYLNIYDEFNKNEYDYLSKNLPIITKCNYKIEERLLLLEYLTANGGINNINKQHEQFKKYKNKIKINSIVNRLKYSNKIIDYCNQLIEYMFIQEETMNKVKIKKILNKIGMENCITILILKKIYYKNMLDISNELIYFNKCILIDECINKINNVEKNKECYTIRGLEIDGRELIKLGYSGSEIGIKLNDLLQQVIKNPNLNNKKDLINMVKEL